MKHIRLTNNNQRMYPISTLFEWKLHEISAIQVFVVPVSHSSGVLVDSQPTGAETAASIECNQTVSF